jgi:hypothetical protein
MHHIFTSHGFSSFFERLPHGLRTDAVGVPQFDQFAGQQTNGPTTSSRGRLAACQRNQVGFLLTIQLAVAVPRLGLAGEHCLQALFDESLANAIDGCQPDVKGGADLLIGPGWTSSAVGLEQNPGAGDLSGGRSTLTHQCLQRLPLLLGQGYHVLLVHRRCPLPGNERNYSQSRTRRQHFNKSWSGH